MESVMSPVRKECLFGGDEVGVGESLISCLSQYEMFEGVKVLVREIKRETIRLKEDSNRLREFNKLAHFEILTRTFDLQDGKVGVRVAIKSLRSSPFRVDIICDYGSKWIKVIARNYSGATVNSVKIIRQAMEYVSFAKQNMFMYKPPTIFFHFGNNINEELRSVLERTGVIVSTALTKENQTHDRFFRTIRETKRLNVDTTAMIAYVSAMTNGSNYKKFNEPMLNQQSESESQDPVKPTLEKLFKGMRLICCKYAFNSFQKIVSEIAGPGEKFRADEFVKKLEIYEDIANIPNDFVPLNAIKESKKKSLKSFAFGVAMKTITVTSNQRFIRLAKMKGVNIPVSIIQPRALTERKFEV